MAHRGGGGGDENGLDTFRAVERLGYRYVETDVRTTRDGVPLLFHDRALERLTGDPSDVSALDLEAIERLRLRQGGAIPSLAAALEELPGLRFNVDLKDWGGVEAVPRVVRAAGADDRVLITSFSQRRVDAARERLGPAVCTALGVEGIVGFVLTGRTRGARAVQVPRRKWGVPLVTRRFVRRAHEAGLAVHVWTVNDADEMHALLDLGVDGIISDEVELLKEVLVERGQWA